MEGLKCPICNAISLVNPITDGEMFTCPFCNHRFTVTTVRRYFLYPKGKNKEQIYLKNLEGLIQEIDDFQLFDMIEMILIEIKTRQLDKAKVK